ncbi:MAG: PTS sugar transporter subunit IIA, partial [Bulleidia sp.]|nr:PTS sugar transporter subunit IIA [Bulleidia sp.]
FFFKDLECESYEDVINQLCDALYGAGRVSEVFKESTFEREKMAWTSLSYGFAIPHPLKYSTIKTTVAVASLKKPVQWGNFKVKFVMLLAVKEEDKDILRIFFDWFSNVCDDPVLLSQITVAQNVNELMELMTK